MGSKPYYQTQDRLGAQNTVPGMVPMYPDADGVAQPITPLDGSQHGVIISTGTSAVAVPIPNLSNGDSPSRLRIVATAAAYVRLGGGLSGTSAEVSDPGDNYAIGEEITLAGGTPDTPAVLAVSALQLVSAVVNNPGTDISVGDEIDTVEGDTPATLTVTHTQVVSATVAVAGTGGTPGAATVTGTTGTGTKFQAEVTIGAGGDIESVDSITVAGDYTVDPTTPASEPVTGGSLTGAELAIVLGALTVDVSDGGVFTDAPTSLEGDGVDVTFNLPTYGVQAATVVNSGDYQSFPSNPVAQDSSTGSGTGATFDMSWGADAAAGDMLVQPGDSVTVNAIGYGQVSAIRVSANGVVQITPLGA